MNWKGIWLFWYLSLIDKVLLFFQEFLRIEWSGHYVYLGFLAIVFGCSSFLIVRSCKSILKDERVDVQLVSFFVVLFSFINVISRFYQFHFNGLDEIFLTLCMVVIPLVLVFVLWNGINTNTVKGSEISLNKLFNILFIMLSLSYLADIFYSGSWFVFDLGVEWWYLKSRIFRVLSLMIPTIIIGCMASWLARRFISNRFNILSLKNLSIAFFICVIIFFSIDILFNWLYKFLGFWPYFELSSTNYVDLILLSACLFLGFWLITRRLHKKGLLSRSEFIGNYLFMIFITYLGFVLNATSFFIQGVDVRIFLSVVIFVSVLVVIVLAKIIKIKSAVPQHHIS